MVTSPEFRKTYKAKLHPDKRKAKYLDITLAYLNKGKKLFFDISMALYGGLTPEMVKVKEDVDPDVICATSWFKLVPLKDAGKYQILQPNILKRFIEYLGAEPSNQSLEYIQGNFDATTHAWVDCREQYLALLKLLKIDPDDMAVDLMTIFREGYFPLFKGAEHEPRSSISSMFGGGPKEDRNVKSSVCKRLFQQVEEQKPQRISEFQSLILKAMNATDAKDFQRKYAGKAGGRHNFLDKILLREDDSEVSEQWRKEFLASCKSAFKGKAEPIQWRCMAAISTYIHKSLNVPYYLESWSEMFKSALSDIVGKNSRNYTYATKQCSDRKELANIKDGAKNAAILNGFFKSPFFTADNEFCISPQHIGGRNIEQFFKALEKGESSEEELISEYMSEIKLSLDKNPVYSLLKYIASIKDHVSAKDVTSGAAFNSKQEKLNRQKVHPTVNGSKGFTWGVSALKGTVVPPDQAQQNNEHATPDVRVWITVELLNEHGKWIPHHVPFFNTRFYEEVYAYNPDPKAAAIKYRTARYGYIANNAALNQNELEAIHSAPDHLRDVVKRICRVQANIRSGTLPNAEWHKQAINIKRLETGDFQIAVTMKSPCNKPKTGPLQIGERVLSYDQGQTANHAYGIVVIVDKDHPGAIPYRNYMAIVESTGDIESTTSGVDQLSYPGVSYECYQDWRKSAKAFVKKYQYSSLPNKNGEHIDYVAEFDKMIAWQDPLYQFNGKYAKLLCKIMRGKTKAEVKEIRSEIIRFLTGKFSVARLSSLNWSAFDALNNTIGLINAYFSNMLKVDGQKVQRYTDEEKAAIDAEMFSHLQCFRETKQNKNKEKIKRNANALIRIAIDNKIDRIVGESDLAQPNKKSKKKQNARNMDWLARGLASKIAELAPMHNISTFLTDPQFTSHQDPFVHRCTFDNPQPAMRARYREMPIEKIGDWVMKKLSVFLKNTTVGSTATYYYQGALDFIANYGLEEHADAIRGNKLECWQLQKILTERLGGKDKIVYIPMRGGRVYLTTYKLTTEAFPIVYNRQNLWVSNADQVAALNVQLSSPYLYPLAKKASDEETN